jgi:ribonuclease HII
MGRETTTTAAGWRFERRAHRSGFVRVVGIDEAGRGPLAGPVVAAAVIFSPGFRMDGLADSKQIAHERRVELAEQIRANSLAVGFGVASAEEIDRINVLAATRVAAKRAVEALAVAPDYFITDYLELDWAEAPVEALVRGDQRCASVAAASIIAKVARDEMMCAYEGEFPDYGFASHKGYGTVAHLDALRALGPTTIHRLTFRGVAWFDIPLRHSKTFEHLAEAIAAVETDEDARLARAKIAEIGDRLPERERIEIEAIFEERVGSSTFRLERLAR